MEYKMVVEQIKDRYTVFVFIAGLPSITVEAPTRIEALAQAIGAIINYLIQEKAA